jgi:PAS domain S-box-containing protein
MPEGSEHPARATPPGRLAVPGPGQAAPRARMEARRLAVLLLAVLGLMIGTFAALTLRDRHEALEDGWVAAERGAQAAADHAERALAAAAMVTDRLAETVRREGHGHYAGPGWPELGAAAAHAPQIGSLWIIDAEGALRATSLQRETPAISLRDRPYFEPLRAGAATELIPLSWGPVSHSWFFGYNRRITDAEGGFAGVAQASMHAHDFHRFYAGLGLGEAARIGLFRIADAAPVMLWPAASPQVASGDALLPAPRTPAGEAVAAAARLGAAGRLEIAAPGDPPLLLAWRRVEEGGGLVAAAAIPRAEALRPYRARLARDLALLAVSAALVLALGAAVAAAQRRGDAARREAEAGRRAMMAMLESTNDSVMTLDPDWRITYMNRHAVALIGRGADLRGQVLWDCYPGAVGNPFWQAYQHSMASGEASSAADFSPSVGRWLEAKAHPSELGGIVVFLRDVTEERLAAQRVADSEARLRAVLENVPVGVLMAEAPSGRIVLTNRRAEQLLGHPPLDRDAAEGPRGWSAQHADGRMLALEEYPLARALAGDETPGAEYRYRRPDGTLVWLRSAAAPLRDAQGRVTGAVVALADVEAERNALEAVRESERRFREMADSAPVMIRVTEGDDTCTFLNRAWAEFTGHAGEAGLGQGWLDTVHPEDQGRLRMALAEAAAAHRDCRLEYRLRRFDGAWRWALEAAAPRLGPGGRVLGFIASVIDIGDRREAEERRALLAREVDHRAKNVLAVVQSVIALTRAEDPAGFRAAATGRIAALARAHTLLAREGWGGAGLREIAEQELAAYGAAPGEPPRFALDGPPVQLMPDAAQPLAMALHELVTNAAKHGALAVPEGRVGLTWQRLPDGKLRLRWEERGGLPVAGAPTRQGFGSQVIRRTVERQLGGSIAFEWREAGLACEITLPAAQLRPAA